MLSSYKKKGPSLLSHFTILPCVTNIHQFYGSLTRIYMQLTQATKCDGAELGQLPIPLSASKLKHLLGEHR